MAIPSRRPAVSEETITESAPDCMSRCWFSLSRTLATIIALGAISRTDRVISTAVSSDDGATMTDLARLTAATRSTPDLVPLPCTVIRPRCSATERAAGSESMTTIDDGDAPPAIRASIAERPLVP